MKTTDTSGNAAPTAAPTAAHHEPEGKNLSSVDGDQMIPEESETTDEKTTTQRVLDKKIEEMHNDLCAFGPKNLPIAIELGVNLQCLKAAVGHGKWSLYLETRFPNLKIRSASDYFLLAKHAELLKKSATVADLGIVEALALIRGRKGAREAPESTIILLATGERVPLRKLGWKQGFVPEDLVVSKVTDMNKPGSTLEDDKKLVAGRQRAFVRFAGDVNRIHADFNELSETTGVIDLIQGFLRNLKTDPDNGLSRPPEFGPVAKR